MSETPSWLKEETSAPATKTAVSNPIVQSTGKAIASDPAVQRATYNALKEHYIPPTCEDKEKDVESQTRRINDTDNVHAEDDDVPEELDVPPEDLKMMEQYHRGLRVSFMAISILMATAACLKLENTDVATAFIALYVVFFSIVICCFELALSFVSKWIATNFGFLYSLSGRVLFLTFVAVMCFSLGIFGQIVMGLTFAALLFNVYVLIVYPKFDQWLRIKHYKNIKG
jgi:hypothetical protein